MNDGVDERDGSEDRESILDVIERTTGEAPSVSLPEGSSDVGSSPIALDPSMQVQFSTRVHGEYQVLGEVARGGMGVILRGHDPDLRRDVAIKVLDEQLAHRPEVVQRFVEEAQIGGQLQHPGIVPVYELGLMADERPFFTMKLVKGRTLASMLRARKSSTDDLRRFLSIFERICQTLAYAHSKHVIHRDLKPANIMLGAFGEVQVVDWGLAKVLLRGGVADEKRALRDRRTMIETVRSEAGSTGSDSIAGSIMGTPAYMPPEQARGEVEALDERTDVFALGALLCEILTGSPPYVEGTDGESVVLQAARAHLAPARERIERSGADEELQRLCLECLAPAPQSRPPGAEVVARAVHEHLSRAEERAHQAQLDATAAHVKVVEERKRRRLTVALAGTIVSLLVAIGGGYLWVEQQRATRLAGARERIDTLQTSALELQAAGRHEDALTFANDALDLVESEDLGAELVERMTDFVAHAESLAAEGRVQEDLAQRNEALFDRLDRIFLLRTQAVAVPWEDVDRAYGDAFHDYGLDIESENLVEVLAELRERGMGAELALEIDYWARAKRAVYGWRSFEAQGLTALAADLDPDEDRMLMRSALFEQDSAALFRMADEVDVTKLPPETLWVLALAVLDLEGDAHGLLARAVRAYPEDFRFHMQLANVYWEEGLPEQALTYAEAAHALRPDHAYLIERLAYYHRATGGYPRSVRLYRELLERVPEPASSFQELAFGLFMLGEYAEAIAFYERALESSLIDPMSVILLEGTRFLADLYTPQELTAALDAVAEQGAFNQQVESFVLLAHPEPARRDPERALAVLQELPLDAETDGLTWACLALANHRLDRSEETLAVFAEVDLQALAAEDAVMSMAVAAVAHHRLGETEAARKWLARAWRRLRVATGMDVEAWQRSVYFAVLAEADALIG